MNKQLQGVFCPLTTPFREDGSLDLEGLAANVRRYAAEPVDGYLVLGSNGENKSLRLEEKRRVVETVLSNKAAGQSAMIASIFESTCETIDFAQEAERLGADFITLLPPSYFRKFMTDAALVRYFTDVASAVKTPCLLYNAPQFAGTLALAPSVLRECAGHPNIVGVKDSSGAIKSAILALEDSGAAVLSGSADTFFDSLLLGAAGGVISLANSSPEAVARLYRYATNGKYEEAASLNRRILKANRAISGRFGVAGVKAAMELCGYIGGSPRPPLLPLPAQEREGIRKALELVRS